MPFYVYIESIGEPELIDTVDTLDEAWNIALNDIQAAFAASDFDVEYKDHTSKPACVVKYQKEYVKHDYFVIYEKPAQAEFSRNDVIWIANLEGSCYYAMIRKIEINYA